MLNKWDIRFLGMAKHVAFWSRDPSTKVGAVIVDNKRRIVSLGFNGFPRGVADDNRLHDRDTKYEMILHAEVNALMFPNKSVEGCTLYVWPLPPCSRCAAQIIQAGIKRVVAPAIMEESLLQRYKSKWVESSLLATEMFKEAGVQYFYPLKDQLKEVDEFFQQKL